MSAPALATPFTVLIPARMSSTRLPDKPLADIGGLPMIARVARQAMQSQAQQVIVATDDVRIQHACMEYQIASVLTRSDHPSGSDRLAEAATLLGLPPEHIIVNVQGDEPFIPPALINATAQLLQEQEDCVMGTAAHPIASVEEFQNPNVVKVVLNGQSQAQYFSRACIAYNRQDPTQLSRTAPPLRHIGIYSYRTAFLQTYPTLSPAPTEEAESLEQLRVLWHGHRIAVHISPDAPAAGVDTPEDLERARRFAQQA